MLKIKYIATEDLIPYINNSRTHSKAQVDQIIASINEFGFTNPVLIDENQGIIAGHGRVSAAIKIGIDKIPTICLENLTDEQKAAYVIADNKLALNADWDIDVLEKELNDLNTAQFDIKITGFSIEELQSLTDFDFTDDIYTPDEEESYNEGIIQYVLIFDDEQQQSIWNKFLSKIKQDFPHLPTHSSRIIKYLEESGI